MSIDTQDDQLARRIADLVRDDAQFAAARPDDAVTEAVNEPSLRLAQIMDILADGYADRPALGARAVDLVTDPTSGRTTTTLLPRFETITYRELWARVCSVAASLADGAVSPGDRVGVLGFTSVDYAVIDMATVLLGAVCVPLQTSAPLTQLQPIVDETEPTLIAASVDRLDDAVELTANGAAVGRLVVFDLLSEVDDHRDAVADARRRLSDGDHAVTVETLTDVIARGESTVSGPVPVVGEGDPLSLLIYTSGSTGRPKGAMYPESLVTNAWRRTTNMVGAQGTTGPSITLSFMPMSHVMGRHILFETLASGGTSYFAATSDLSTFLEDLALVRPTLLSFVPRIWEMIFTEHQSALSRRVNAGEDEATASEAVSADLRGNLLGGRYVAALTGSAPISAEMTAFVESLLGLHLVEGYGSTEAGMVFIDGAVRRPPVIDYKLVDVPDLGYFHTDRPNPRGELLVKSDTMFPGYFNRPDATADVFDEDGYYRTGDVVAETGPDQLVYLDRRNNVLKLSQGEFVTVSKVEAVFADSPVIGQIYIYGNSARAFLLAVVVPTDDALAQVDGDVDAVKPILGESLQRSAKAAGLQSYEIPRDFIVETTPFTLENGLLTGIRKLARPRLKEQYGEALERRYADLADGQTNELQALRREGNTAPVIESVSRAAAALLSASASDVQADAHFTDLGGDSLSAVTFANLLREIFDIEVPVGVIVNPAADLAAIADYIENERTSGATRPTFATVHGADATEVHAKDLTLDKFVDAETLAAAPTLPRPSEQVRTVLLTGATGFLGRFLALEWLERMDLVDGTLICIVRAKDDAAARARLDATFDSGDPQLLARYEKLAADYLQVVAGDKSEADLGLDAQTWQRIADTVDLIVDPAALVNHVLPYAQLFGPNALGTAELIRIALTSKLKQFAYVSTIGVGAGIEPTSAFVEAADIREISATRAVDESYANGYGTSKWAGEVLLREAHDLCGLPVAVFRCDMILADTQFVGQLNVPDMFTRLMLSLVATGVAPKSFYELDADGNRQRAHYDGLPVDFISEAISTLSVQLLDGFETYHVMNPYDDGIGQDEFVDWLVDAGYSIQRVDGYDEWLQRFETAVRALPAKQRSASLLPLLHNYQQPVPPLNGAMAPTDRFRAAVQDAKIGPDKDIPHITPQIIVKYATNLEVLGLL
ncbi:carboxylic acid reductase [Williamsia phyllosphaerae]|uniref:Carboxylic acid reductase n=1 Tax=Williamsia phyllosphaerae TaxID=885042 RepID=A0ABQ1V3W2_9NOCA|nr:carboxylic acid reductase [Williamsia phyllosphaerae]GGF37068.1 oxidoreductase [Williamsia phyllosphaerae]